MKPSKKLIYCPACGRQKMIFQTQKEAEQFISFNREEILEETGKAPIRSYYCKMCCAYHVTSTASHDLGADRDAFIQQMIDSVLPQTPRLTVGEEEQFDKEQALSIVESAKKKMICCQVDMAEQDLNNVLNRADDVARKEIEHTVRALQGLISRYRAIVDNRRTLRAASKINPKGWMDELFRDMAVFKLDVLKMDRLFEQMESTMKDGDMELFSSECKYIRKWMYLHTGPGGEEIRSRCHSKLRWLLRNAGRLTEDCPEDRKEILTNFILQLAANLLEHARGKIGLCPNGDVRRCLAIVDNILAPLDDCKDKQYLDESANNIRAELNERAQLQMSR